MNTHSRTAALLSEGQNADAYFANHSTAPMGTIAAFLGLKKNGSKKVREVLVKNLGVGSYNEYGEFTASDRNNATQHVVVKGDHPHVTYAGYQAVRARQILSLEKAARIAA